MALIQKWDVWVEANEGVVSAGYVLPPDVTAEVKNAVNTGALNPIPAGSTQNILVSTTTLTAAQLMSTVNVPPFGAIGIWQLIAPVAGKIIRPQSVFLLAKYGTKAFTCPNNFELILESNAQITADGNVSYTILTINQNVLTQSNDYTYYAGFSDTLSKFMVNQPLQLVAGGPIGQGDGSLTVVVYYALVPSP